jgi:hypothetical protein
LPSKIILKFFGPTVAPSSVAGQRPHDIEQAWQVLEREEHLREVALKEELLRQEKLEQLAFKFERKSVLREGYLNEMIQVGYIVLFIFGDPVLPTIVPL